MNRVPYMPLSYGTGRLVVTVGYACMYYFYHAMQSMSILLQKNTHNICCYEVKMTVYLFILEQFHNWCEGHICVLEIGRFQGWKCE